MERLERSVGEHASIMARMRRSFARSAFWALVVMGVLGALCAGCGGGSSLPSSVSASGTSSVAQVRARSTVSAAATPTPKFNTWPTYGYDNAHNGYNPNSKLFTDASIAQLHLGWEFKLGESGSQTQPILATNIGTHAGVLYVGGRSGVEYAVDALTGTQVWSQSFGSEQMQCVNNGPLLTLGIEGTAVYDPVANVVYIVDSKNSAPNAAQTITIYQLNPLTGATLGSVNVTPSNLAGEIDFAHTGLTLAAGTLYVGTGSTCDLSSWRGRVAAVTASSMMLANTFFTVYNQGGTYSGGGVWGWGGAAIGGAGDVYIGVGNADINKGKIAPQPPFQTTTNEQVGYGEHVVRLTSDLSTVEASYAIPYTFNKTATNLDLSGTPVLYTPVGCPQVLAIQGKAGIINFYNAAHIDTGPLGSFTFSEAVDNVAFIGNGAYSPLTGLYYVNVPTGEQPSQEQPGMVGIGVTNCTTPSIVWDAQFGADSYNIGSYDGQPRSAPTVTAGGVVFVASPQSTGKSQLWALDATTGNVLNGGTPILTTPNLVRMPPVVDGQWMYVIDQGGHLYGLTIDSSVPAKQNTFPQVYVPEPAW